MLPVSEIAALDLRNDAELIEDLTTLLLEPGERISREVCVIIEIISMKEKLVDYFSIWLPAKSVITI
jgi:hypothetical protein